MSSGIGFGISIVHEEPVDTGGTPPPPSTHYLLMENGDRILSEDGADLIRKE